jgi:pimeloyl-ACP methyl ester carboxylesterase
LPPQVRKFDAVILLHCSASSSRQWARLIASAPEIPMTAIDLHGYGAMPMPAVAAGVPFTLDREVDLVEAAIIGAGPVALIGHSYGGAVALMAARRLRDRIRAVVAHEPVLFALLEKNGEPDLHAETREMEHRIEDLVADGRSAEAVELFVEQWGVPGFYATLKPEQRANMASLARKVVLDIEALLGSPGDLQFFEGLPALITYGDQSRAPAIHVARLLGGLYGGAVVIPGAGHMAPVTHPDEFQRIALEFILNR